MEFVLENDLAYVKIDSFAAQISSFYKKSDRKEIMWQGDERYWKGKNPTLFPQVGNTYDGIQKFKGESYMMKNHGFARNFDYELVDSQPNKIKLALRSNEETKKLYPYDFVLYISYCLNGSKLSINYEIQNNDDETMPFGFGLHPGFNCPINTDGEFRDVVIEFSSKEDEDDLQCRYIVDRKLHLKRSIFDECPTLIYRHINSAYTILSYEDTKIKISNVAFPILAIWSAKDAPFVCIEPWYSHSGDDKKDMPFCQRSGIINLGSKQSFSTAYSIEIL